MADPAVLLELAEAGNYDALEEAWIENADRPPQDLAPYLAAASRLEQVGEAERAGSILALLVEPLLNALRHAEALEVIKRAGRLAPQAFDARGTAAKALRGMHEQNRLTGIALQLARLDDARIPGIPAGDLRTGRAVVEGIALFEKYLRFSTGCHVYHSASWGTGRVLDADERGNLLIDFERKRQHRMPIASAVEFLQALPDDDLRAMKFSRLPDLRTMAASDPLALLRKAVAFRGGSSDVRRVREDLEPIVGDWANWWKKARRLALQDPYLDFEGGARGFMKVRERPITFAEEMAAKIAAAKDMAEAASLARRFERESSGEETSAVYTTLAQCVRKVVGQEDPPPRGIMDGLLLLDANAPENPSVTAALGTTPAELLRQIIRGPDAPADPSKASRARLKTLVSEAASPRFRKCVLEISRSLWPEGWARLHRDLLLDLPELWHEIVPSLLKEAPSIHEELVRTVAENPIVYPGAFLELADEVHTGKTATAALSREEVPHRLLGVIEVLKLGARTGDPVRANRLIERAYEVLGPALLERLKVAEEEEARTLWYRADRPELLGHDLWSTTRRFVADSRKEILREVARAFWDDETAIYSTQAGIRKLQSEFSELIDVKIPANARAIGEAASHGDLSENAEFTAALEERDQLARKAELMKGFIQKVRPIEGTETPVGVACPGCRVTVTDLGSGVRTTYTILGPWDADLTSGVISYTAPLARGLMGHRAGDRVEVALPDTSIRCIIEAIEKAI